MRNFFKDTLHKMPSVHTKQIADMLDTREEKVIRHYRDCLKYITRVKNDVLHKTEEFLFTRRVSKA